MSTTRELAVPTRHRVATTSRAAGAVLVLAAAAVLGVYADVGQLLPGALSMVPQLGAPWVLLAVAGGALVRRVTVAVGAGIGLVLLGLVAYVIWKAAAYGPSSNGELRYTWPYWAALALAVGSTSGAAGALVASSAPRRRAVGIGFLAGALCAEAVALPVWFTPQEHAVQLAAVEAAVAAIVVLAGVRRTAAAVLLPTAAVTAGVGVAAAWVAYSVF